MNSERQPSTDDVPAPRFSQNFWGKDDAGYSALTTRMRHAKVTCQEILGMFQARAALEEEYGKKLVKLSKSPLGKDEVGSLRDSLDVVRFEIEATGKSHIELASKMRDQLESALEEFNNGQKDKRKLHQASIDRTFRNKQLYLQQLVKAKEKYDAECVRTKGLSAAKMNLVGKELDKVSVKMEKNELASRAADVEYQASIRQLTEINDKWIIEWRAACDKFQLLEEQRIDYVGTTLWNYANIISSTCVADDESCERIRASLELCDVNQNLQSFVDASATGDDVPDVSTYLNAKNNEGGHEGAVDSPANLRSQTQDMKPRTVSGPHQPLPGADLSNPPSRRQSYYSTEGRSDPGGIAAGQVDMALTIGGNVFKLDPQTTALLNQADDPVAPSTGGFPAPHTNGDRSPVTTPGIDLRQSALDNSLGISLDVSGTVKENRFPHWQPQAPLQQQQPNYPMADPAPSHPYQQQRGPAGMVHSPNHVGPAVATQHIGSQTIPLQNDPNRTSHHDVDTNQHHRSMAGANIDPSLAQHSQRQYQGQQNSSGGIQVAPALTQASHDGRPILFYVRVLYDYDATIPEELSLRTGDILAVLHTRDDGWWEGNLLDDYRGPMRGLFPSNFTEPTA
ncbi:Proline-serine-threonine phosphatase-interacting protein 2 [Linnemannia gamsii]|uniref:Proline-serine-threonine phosphatase-interacting protein 2 n=1 Tax=Linnemannia gamsii TaxID=64522 RepID=A0A9P6R6Y8_9FUNG|nr:Proline-serine-threonine phosphatase-interacting protein 2 [Linnemannia gamsii]